MTEILAATFMERHFGDHAQAVADALVAAAKAAHGRSLDAKIGSGLKSDHAYGSTYWLALPEEVVARLLPILDGATPFPPRGAQYELLVWNDIAILPVKVMENGKRDGRMRARISDLRARLTRMNVPKPPEPTLFDNEGGLDVDEFEAEALKVAEAAQAAMGSVASKMVVAAFACNSKSGLRIVRVGIATLDTDGHINFSDSEKLSLMESPQTVGKPVRVAGDSFDSAPRPRPILEAIDPASATLGTNEGDAEPGAESDASSSK